MAALLVHGTTLANLSASSERAGEAGNPGRSNETVSERGEREGAPAPWVETRWGHGSGSEHARVAPPPRCPAAASHHIKPVSIVFTFG